MNTMIDGGQMIDDGQMHTCIGKAGAEEAALHLCGRGRGRTRGHRREDISWALLRPTQQQQQLQLQQQQQQRDMRSR